MKRREIGLAFIIAVAIAASILSLPEFLEPFAKLTLERLGPYWSLAVFVVGLVDGLEPDEDSWPVTLTYAMMQRSKKGVLVAVSVFAAALTLVWTLVSLLAGMALWHVNSDALAPYADVLLGITMLAAAYVLTRRADKSVEARDGKAEKEVAIADLKVILVHGIVAAFGGGGDVIIILVIAAALAPFIGASLLWVVGLFYGAGSWMSQMVVVSALWGATGKAAETPETMARAGRLVLLFLGVFTLALGVLLMAGL
ncbi:MAG: hypothetical protein RXR41_05045 [Candidatus Marsarchaeota archaeon]